MSLQQAASSYLRRGGLRMCSMRNAKSFQPQIAPIARNYAVEIQSVQPLFKIDLSLPSLWNEFTLLIKRTFQPSIIRKRRKTGFLKRQKSVGGRRVLKRRALKGRVRLGGC